MDTKKSKQEFAEYKLIHDFFYGTPLKKWIDHTNYINLFKDDWNQLMDVVEKIESLDKMRGIVTIYQGMCKITSAALGDHTVYAMVDHYFYKGAAGKKIATYTAVVEFILLYNNNNGR